VATSGNYERGYEVGSGRFSHILDPRTGYPVDCADAPGGKKSPLVASATVIAWDNGTANALAAGLMVLSPEEGLALVGRTRGTEALIVLADGRQLRSDGFLNYVTVSPAIVGTAWRNGAQVSLTIQQNQDMRDRPYMAVWVENDRGEHVATLVEWGNKEQFISSLNNWTRAIGNNMNLMRMVSRATRPTGKFTFNWDGKDQAGKLLPAGIYKINVELASEHNGHSLGWATIACGNQPAQALISRTRLFDDILVTFSPKGN
jgi:hypothetical protein